MRAARLVVLCALLGAPPALAETPAAGAKQAFERGLAAFDEGRYSEAASEFERSLALKETPAVWYNLALAYYRLARWDVALSALERHVALEPPRESEARQIREMSDELKAKLALLEISVRTPDTTVFLDGRELKERRAHVMPGWHELEALRPGHRPVKKSATLEAGARLATELSPAEPLPARVLVRTTPADAQILIDGAPLGIGEYRGELEPGEHRIEGKREDHALAFEVVRLSAGDEKEIALVLTEESAPIYETWWFWTAAGAVVLAGAAIAIGVAAQPGFDGGSIERTVQVLSP